LLRLTSSPMVFAFVLVTILTSSQGGDHKGKEDQLIADMKFVRIPKGTFWMSQDYKNAQKKVEIKEDFELAAYTVTQEQWQQVMGENPSKFSRKRGGKDAVKDISDADLKKFPVEMVSWDDAQKFLSKLNEREKGKGWVYRLPTEAEWEYACRNAASSKEDCSFDFYFEKGRNDLSSKEANFNGELPAGNGVKGPKLDRPTKVGSYAANKLGLFDMHGNVWQWCEDRWDDKGPERVFRGGCYGEDGEDCRAANRNGCAPGSYFHGLGLRVARALSGSKQ
jgi:formylglycine-generating enzyme required for sulfatase activity